MTIVSHYYLLEPMRACKYHLATLLKVRKHAPIREANGWTWRDVPITSNKSHSGRSVRVASLHMVST